MASEQFSLCWDNFHKNMSSGMHSLLESGDLVDVTLAVEGKCLKAHKMVLSVCSPYFRNLFKTNPCKHPIVFMKDVTYTALSDLLQFMYQGEVQVSQENLSTFIKTAEALQIKGLTGDGTNTTDFEVTEYSNEENTKHSEKPAKAHQETEILKTTPTITRTKRQLGGRPVKRIKTSTPSVSEATVKSDSSTTGDPVQFKMEPYEIGDSTVHEHDTSADDSFGADGTENETTQQEDTEDYSLMEGLDEEPQAGTSGEGAGEGQDSKMRRGYARRALPRTSCIFDGFVYHTRKTREDSNKRYLACAERQRFGCPTTAVMPINGDKSDLILKRPHNHPPDSDMEERNAFINELKFFVKAMKNATLKKVYDTAALRYPNCALEIPFRSISTSMRRWRKELSVVDDSINNE